MDMLHSRYYKINKILMSLVGQWPHQSKLQSRVFLSLLTLLCITQIIPQIIALFEYYDQPEILIESVSPFILDTVCFVKLIACIIQSKKRLKLLNRMNEDWITWSVDREVSILYDYADIGRKLSIAYTGAILLTCVIFLSQPVIPKIVDILVYNGSLPGEFPFPVYYYLIDQQNYYFYIIGWTYVCVFAILTIMIAIDTMFITYVQHCCGIFAALGCKLKRMGEEKRLINGRDLDFDDLVRCIVRHNQAIEFAKLIEGTYSGCFFFVVGLNMIIMSITGIQIITRTNKPEDTIRFIGFVGAQLVHLFIESYISQILMDHSVHIRDCIHHGKWYNISLKSQKLLNLMIMRCNTPCKLTAGKICIMSVETFGVVVKSSISYFTLLRSVQ